MCRQNSFRLNPNDGQLVTMSEDEPEIIATTPFLQLVQRDRWSYARRTNSVRVVAIAATTANEEIILVEQYRLPVQTNVIELPAGLAGDIAGEENESLQRAAERELLEETGFVAEAWETLGDFSSSAGMTDEVVTLFRADGLTREGQGGGVDNEQITVHLVSKRDAVCWLMEQQAAGKLIDGRVYAGLHLTSLNRD